MSNLFSGRSCFSRKTIFWMNVPSVVSQRVCRVNKTVREQSNNLKCHLFKKGQGNLDHGVSHFIKNIHELDFKILIRLAGSYKKCRIKHDRGESRRFIFEHEIAEQSRQKNGLAPERSVTSRSSFTWNVKQHDHNQVTL